MPAGEALEDDYIVSLLKKDADEHKKRYSMIGNGPLLSTAKRRPDAPKPNTRFLKNIIRETDSHNAALKAKEEGESRARLRELKREERGGKRKREGDGDSAGEERDGGGKRRKERESRPGRWASALGLDGVSERRVDKGRRSDEKRPRRSEDDDKDREGERSTHRHRHRSERSESDRRHHKSRRDHSRERSRSPHHRKEHRRRPHSRSRSPPTRHDGANDSDSDPLTAFLGPQPPTQPLPRGRGALKSSAIDSRFDNSYNPSTDVAPNHSEEEGDDWDMALEALEARTKWRAQGAERLRAAGFTEEEIERWQKGGSGGEGGAEKDVEDVRWRGRGEGREWDRGKVVDDGDGDGEGEGEVVLKAEWAR